MNENLQPDLHPEAEMLNAFAEHALSDHEQQQIVTHLAACSRCRQIVFLAQQAAEEELPAIASPAIATPVQTSLRNWWSDWRILWIAAPACAALLTIVFLPHPKQLPSSQISPATQQARAVPQSSTPSPSPGSPQSTTAPQTTMQMDLRRQDRAPAPLVPQRTLQAPSLLPKPAVEQARQPEPKQAPQSAAQTVSVSAAEVITTDATVSPEPTPQQIAPLPAPAPVPVPNPAANAPKPSVSAAVHIVPPLPPHFAPPSGQPGSGHGFIQGGVALRPSLPATGRAMIPATQKQAMAAARMRVSPA